MALLELENVHKLYPMDGEMVRALDGVSLAVEPGEYLSISGASGSGKTTMMQLMGCLDVPSEGVCRFDGTDICRLSEPKLAAIRNREIGFVFQGFHLVSTLTALENVELPLLYRGIPAGKRRRMAEEALERVGLLERQGHRPNQLSGGQQQRTAIARAVAAAPRLLLCDEPTGSLDPESSRQILALLEDFADPQHTLILITHDMAIAERARRRVLVEKGKIAAEYRRSFETL